MTCPAALSAARSLEVSAKARRIAGSVSGALYTMYLRHVHSVKSFFFVESWFQMYAEAASLIPELCDNSIAGSSSSQCKEEVIVLLVEHRAWPWRKNLEGKFLPEEQDSLTFVFSGVTSAILPSAKTTLMLRICSAP